jgi:ketosteroid isomerase-like protein
MRHISRHLGLFRRALRTLGAAVLITALSSVAHPGLGAQEHGHEGGHDEHAAQASSEDRAAIESTVAAYHRALAEGDRAAAERLLADDVIVLESGGSEDKAHYMEHHLPGDMAFAAAVPRERGPMKVTVVGDVAWVTSTSLTRGTYRDREIDSTGAELMVLVRHDGEWRIHAIHWSSRPNRRG